ncbi:PilN domain-containing protein [Oceanisphaera avium]|uniref:Fimbrial assembly protein n=1 Tax=Oceanisphaera avium TaxID=1903694 RepID=A0A1Y0D1I1_9GAMM|nr:PilN domain-containing protein [Oceanisphaera avium]ART81204.1 hypothetical protein CBP12_12965 [Oceanisphaera avium]
MSNINLLPWREWQHLRHTRHFMALAFGVAILSLMAAWINSGLVKRKVILVQQRNQQLQQMSDEQGAQLVTLEQQHKQINQLAWQDNFIQHIRFNNRPVVQLINDLPLWLPTGVKLSSLHFSPPHLELKGEAHTYQQLSLTLQAIEASAWVHTPLLTTQALSEERNTQFVLRVSMLSATPETTALISPQQAFARLTKRGSPHIFASKEVSDTRMSSDLQVQP